MAQPAGTSMKAERDQLRDRMRSLGCSLTQIALKMSRQFDLQPRLAWRHALGWTQSELARRYNIAHPGAGLLANRVSKYETWPHGSGGPPSLRYLSGLATTYGHDCTLFRLVDVDDMQYLSPRTVGCSSRPATDTVVTRWARFGSTTRFTISLPSSSPVG
jgi:transcriptional regulator with XRE-family HTH domain